MVVDRGMVVVTLQKAVQQTGASLEELVKHGAPDNLVSAARMAAYQRLLQSMLQAVQEETDVQPATIVHAWQVQAERTVRHPVSDRPFKGAVDTMWRLAYQRLLDELADAHGALRPLALLLAEDGVA